MTKNRRTISMEWNRPSYWCCNSLFSSMILFLSLFMLIGFSSASAFISDDIFESHASTGRNLLQVKKACPVNFEVQNYTIITSQCKGPPYPRNLCCSAFKEFACPFVVELNDSSNDCVSIMFSYILLNRKYPPTLFADLCQEGKDGLTCPALPPSESDNASGSPFICSPSAVLMLTAGLIVVLLRLF